MLADEFVALELDAWPAADCWAGDEQDGDAEDEELVNWWARVGVDALWIGLVAVAAAFRLVLFASYSECTAWCG